MSAEVTGPAGSRRHGRPSRLAPGSSSATTAGIAVAVKDILAKYVTPSGVLMPAAVWIVLAHYP